MTTSVCKPFRTATGWRFMLYRFKDGDIKHTDKISDTEYPTSKEAYDGAVQWGKTNGFFVVPDKTGETKKLPRKRRS